MRLAIETIVLAALISAWAIIEITPSEDSPGATAGGEFLTEEIRGPGTPDMYPDCLFIDGWRYVRVTDGNGGTVWKKH